MFESFHSLISYWQFVSPYMQGYLRASIVVLLLTVGTVLLSWACGLIAALGKSSKNSIIRAPFTFYVWFIRGTPSLIQIFLIYFGLPQLGMRLSPFVAGVLALGINSGAFVAEIVRAGLSAIPNGQAESARALGMGHSLSFRRIIFPQLVRIVIPPITNEALIMLKNTSLLSTITVMELTMYSQLIIARTFRPFDFYIIAAILYLLMTTVFSSLSVKLEKRYSLGYSRD